MCHHHILYLILLVYHHDIVTDWVDLSVLDKVAWRLAVIPLTPVTLATLTATCPVVICVVHTTASTTLRWLHGDWWYTTPTLTHHMMQQSGLHLCRIYYILPCNLYQCFTDQNISIKTLDISNNETCKYAGQRRMYPSNDTNHAIKNKK